MSDAIFFKRESRRSFLDKPIPEETLQQLFEIIRWSPSCSNNQPWRFIFVTDPDQQARFMEALPRGNQWAAKAPVLVAVCAREADDHSRDDDPVKYYQFDCGLAVMSLLLGATSLGLMGHAMAGYDAAKVKAALEIPPEYHVICVAALGYQGPPDQLEGRNREAEEAPRTRKEISEIICRDRFQF
ncbi:MAG: nitroreductase [Candidatus Zixiibacteriota bacterium]|nr:MAG: nitroreductase [candidate division Zixibacteria bacterium]